jgi:hypothetical protein
MQIDKNLYIEINEYCKLNNIKTRDFIHNILKEGFLKEKYGDKPFFMQEKIKENKITENKDEKLDVVLKVAEKTFGIVSSTVTPDNNMDTTIVMPEEWFNQKKKKGKVKIKKRKGKKKEK